MAIMASRATSNTHEVEATEGLSVDTRVEAVTVVTDLLDLLSLKHVVSVYIAFAVNCVGGAVKEKR
jgi:hypothetical protein